MKVPARLLLPAGRITSTTPIGGDVLLVVNEDVLVCGRCGERERARRVEAEGGHPADALVPALVGSVTESQEPLDIPAFGRRPISPRPLTRGR